MNFTEYCKKHGIKDNERGVYIAHELPGKYYAQLFYTSWFIKKGSEESVMGLYHAAEYLNSSDPHDVIINLDKEIKRRELVLNKKLIFRRPTIITKNLCWEAADELLKNHQGYTKDDNYFYEKYRHLVGKGPTLIVFFCKASDTFMVVPVNFVEISPGRLALRFVIGNSRHFPKKDDALKYFEDYKTKFPHLPFPNLFYSETVGMTTLFREAAIEHERTSTWRERRDARRKENAA